MEVRAAAERRRGVLLAVGPGRRCAVGSPVKAMTSATVVALVVVTAYTVSVGGNPWLWFSWVVLLLATVGVISTRES